jgi:hypothetical protein
MTFLNEGEFLPQTFLLLDDSERDLRLVSTVGNESLTHGHQPTYGLNNKAQHKVSVSIKKLSTVECNLERAHWTQVFTFELSFHIVSIFVLYRMDHSLSKISSSTLIRVI